MSDLLDEFKKSYDEYKIIAQKSEYTWQICFKSYEKIAILKKISNPQIYLKLRELKIKGVPKIIDVFEKDGENYVIEDYINGSSLDEIIASKGILSQSEVRHIVTELCNILEPIHNSEIIHRDIKPSNIMLTKNNEVYLIDFGIARSRNDNVAKDTRLLGTEFYASPEQYGFAQTDNRSDIYSIGKLMIVLLKGNESTESIDSLPYYKIIAKCTEVDALKRYANVKSLKNSIIIYSNKRIIFLVGAALLICGAILLSLSIKSNESIYVDKSAENNLTKTEDSSEIPLSDEETTAIGESGELSETTSIGAAPENSTAANNGGGSSVNSGGSSSVNNGGSSISNKSESQTEKPAEKQTEKQSEPASQNVLNNYPAGTQTNTLKTNLIKTTHGGGIELSGNGWGSQCVLELRYDSMELNYVNLTQGASTPVYTKGYADGLYIEINNKNLFIDRSSLYTSITGWTPYYGHTDSYYIVVFNDFDKDGVKDMFVLERTGGKDDDYNSYIYEVGCFVKVNSDLTMTKAQGANMMMVKENNISAGIDWESGSPGTFKVYTDRVVYRDDTVSPHIDKYEYRLSGGKTVETKLN